MWVAETSSIRPHCNTAQLHACGCLTVPFLALLLAVSPGVSSDVTHEQDMSYNTGLFYMLYMCRHYTPQSNQSFYTSVHHCYHLISVAQASYAAPYTIKSTRNVAWTKTQLQLRQTKQKQNVALQLNLAKNCAIHQEVKLKSSCEESNLSLVELFHSQHFDFVIAGNAQVKQISLDGSDKVSQ